MCNFKSFTLPGLRVTQVLALTVNASAFRPGMSYILARDVPSEACGMTVVPGRIIPHSVKYWINGLRRRFWTWGISFLRFSECGIGGPDGAEANLDGGAAQRPGLPRSSTRSTSRHAQPSVIHTRANGNVRPRSCKRSAVPVALSSGVGLSHRGPSPRLWGTLYGHTKTMLPARSIPTPVGNA